MGSMKVGDLVCATDDLWAPEPSIGFISELRTTLTEAGECAQAKVMWVNGQHYWCLCEILKQCK